jgi:type IV secretion system protein VirB9
VRVYNDSRKTIIQMPSTMAQTEAPTLLVVHRDGGLFSDDETVIVNFVSRGHYVVDTVFDKAILIAGVGSHQDRVTIARRVTTKLLLAYSRSCPSVAPPCRNTATSRKRP